LIAIGYGFIYLIKTDTLSTVMIVGISSLIGGGLGNVIDRILYGSVTDFLYFDFVLFHTGVVNMADISVSTGFFIILYGFYVNRRELNIKKIE
jgi:signal peptidase II